MARLPSASAAMGGTVSPAKRSSAAIRVVLDDQELMPDRQLQQPEAAFAADGAPPYGLENEA